MRSLLHGVRLVASEMEKEQDAAPFKPPSPPPPPSPLAFSGVKAGSLPPLAQPPPPPSEGKGNPFCTACAAFLDRARPVAEDAEKTTNQMRCVVVYDRFNARLM